MSLTQVANRTQGNATALQRLSERDPEVAIEVGVDEWIQRAVEVSYPEYHCHHRVAALAGVAQRRDDIPVETEQMLIDEKEKVIKWMDGERNVFLQNNFIVSSFQLVFSFVASEDQIWINYQKSIYLQYREIALDKCVYDNYDNYN